MATIFYGVSGEGLGHATRVLAVLERLKHHTVHIFTYGQAYDYLTEQSVQNVHCLHGLRFAYKNGRVNQLRLAYDFVRFLWRPLRTNINYILDRANAHRPSLFITDYEPSISRAARRYGSKLLSVDNQHKFVYGDLRPLPWKLRMYGHLCGLATRLLVTKADKTVVSTFHYDRLGTADNDVEIVYGLVRKKIEEMPVTDDGTNLVYMRKSVWPYVCKAIKASPRKFKIYGISPEDSSGLASLRPDFEFLPPSDTFTEDLARCHCLICTAGNQLVSEARMMGKPCLVLPEEGQHEQAINAFYAEQVGMATQCKPRKLTPEILEDFIQWSRPYQHSLTNGVDTVIETIEEMLSNAN